MDNDADAAAAAAAVHRGSHASISRPRSRRRHGFPSMHLEWDFFHSAFGFSAGEKQTVYDTDTDYSVG